MYLGLDLGTSGVKAMLIDGDQRIVGSASSALDVSRPHPGWSEQDPADWVCAAEEAIAGLKAAHSAELAAVSGIGLSGQMHGATLLDADDRVLRPCILWNDTRSFREAAALDADPQFRAITGNIVFPGFTAPKLAWVRANEPEIFAKVRWVLLPKDYLRLWLTGEHMSEMSDSAGTSWLDTGKRRWSESLLAATNMDEKQMPSLVEGTDPAGKLRSELAARWASRVMSWLPAVPATMRRLPAAWARSARGTPSCRLAPRAFSSRRMRVTCRTPKAPCMPSATPCRTPGTRWVSSSRRPTRSTGIPALPAECCGLEQRTRRHHQGPSGVTFLPYLSGERTPHNDAAIRGAFVGLGHESSRVVLTQAVMEGVSFAIRDSLEALRAAGTTLSRVTAIGGGSRSRYWLKSIATALNLPVDLPDDGDFGAAFGAARLGLIAATGADPVATCYARVLPKPSRRKRRWSRPMRRATSATGGSIRR